MLIFYIDLNVILIKIYIDNYNTTIV